MHKPAHPEIEVLRRRWRDILKRAREKGDKPSKADIDAASMVDDPELSALVAETESALEEHSKRRLGKLKPCLDEFTPSATQPPNLIRQFVSRKFRP